MLQSLFKQFSSQPQQAQQQPRLSVEITGGKFMFHYLIERGIVFLTLTDRSYPKKLAFQYLEELCTEFCNLYGTQVDTVSRPYAFIKFGGLHMPKHACLVLHVACACTLRAMPCCLLAQTCSNPTFTVACIVCGTQNANVVACMSRSTASLSCVVQACTCMWKVARVKVDVHDKCMAMDARRLMLMTGTWC
eukprot:360479-Chlamydomonas_euryale.AAC.5